MELKNSTTHCPICGLEVTFRAIDCTYEYREEGLPPIRYRGKRAYCAVCGEELIVDSIENYNQEQFEKAYWKARESVNEPEEVL